MSVYLLGPAAASSTPLPFFGFCVPAGFPSPAQDHLETALSLYIDARMPLPTPSQHVRRQTVRPSALECAKLALYCEMMAQGVRKSELARRLGWHVPQVDRKFNTHVCFSFHQRTGGFFGKGTAVNRATLRFFDSQLHRVHTASLPDSSYPSGAVEGDPFSFDSTERSVV